MKVRLLAVCIVSLVIAACGEGGAAGDDVTTTTEPQDSAAGEETSPTEPPATTAAPETSATTEADSAEEDAAGEMAATGNIAWSPDRDGNREIYVMSLADGSITRLTDNPAVDLYPDWSPDGSHIAFATERDGNREIYVVEADGSNLMRLTDNPGEDTRPAWSPDGSEIAFATQRGPANLELWVMNADGSDQRRLVAAVEAIDAPTWAPDGDRIAYHVEAQFGPFEIESYSIEEEQAEGLFEGAEPSWSPNQEVLAYATFPDLDIGSFDIAAQSQALLVEHPAGEQDPDWSPTGRCSCSGRIATGTRSSTWRRPTDPK